MKYHGNTIIKLGALLSVLLLFGCQLPKNSPAAVNHNTPHRSLNVEHWTTANGARVYFVAAAELPMLDIRLIFDGGGARDGDKPGLAMMTNAMLEEGTIKLTVDAIAAQFENLGADFSTGSYRDMAVANLRTLTEPNLFQPALTTFIEVISQPSFPKTNFERLRKQALIALEHEKQAPGQLATKAFYQQLYLGHPYGIPIRGTEASLTSIGLDNLKQFHQRYYVASNAIIAMVGNLTQAQAHEVADNISQALNKGQPAPALPKVNNPKPRYMHIPHPSSQTHIIMGLPVIRSGDKDYYALYLGNEILGGNGLTSNLHNEIREKRGLAYSIDSDITSMRERGPFSISLQTRKDETQQALDVTLNALKEFIQQGPSAERLLQAKNHITGSFTLSIASNAAIVGQLGAIGFYGLPLNYLDTFTQRIEAVSLEELRRVWQQYIDPNKLIIVTAGNGQLPKAKN